MTNVRIIPPPEEWVDTMNKVTYFLSRESQITDIRPSDIRYVKLQTQEMFDKLVDLYAEVFLTQLHRFRRSMLYFSLYFPPETAVPPHIYAARCYISIWFIDLYYCNRLAVEKLSPVAFKERYQGELSLISHEYDTYLTLLNASIRPTLIQNASKNTRYIPIIADCIDVKNPNPFRIKNFTPKKFFFYGFTELMKIRNLWSFSLISNDARGRPCWLFDWHSGKNACAWFPSKDNYDLGDVTLAYILGAACTPKLGVRDVDEWQYFADGIVPHDPNPSNYDRVAKRQFYGSYEIRVMEIDREFSLASILAQVGPSYVAEKDPTSTKKRRRNDPAIAIGRNKQTALSEESQEVDQPMPQIELYNKKIPRFRLIDWVYDCRVIRNMDEDLRNVAHRCMTV